MYIHFYYFIQVCMPTPHSPSIFVSESEKSVLQSITRQSTASYRSVFRCKLILQINEGLSNTQVCQNLKVSRPTVKKWRYKWLGYQSEFKGIDLLPEEDRQKKLDLKLDEFLNDQNRPGCPSTFTAEQYCNILSVALEPPKNSGRSITHWTGRELAEECILRKIVSSISSTQISNFLKKNRCEASSV